MSNEPIPKAFFWRRLHSLAGLWLVFFIIEHLLVNSQAALLVGNDGQGFINSANAIHDLPYLPIIEIAVLAVPILIHMLWGIKYALSGEMNSFGDSGATPYLPAYPRNQAYSWQRITSYLLVIGILAHVVHMRFLEYPSSARLGSEQYYMVKLSADPGLYTLAQRINFKLYDQAQVQKESATPLVPLKDAPSAYQASIQAQNERQRQEFIEKLKAFPLPQQELVAVADNFGTAELLMLRNTFKSPLMLVLYTFFVLAAGFHAFNGLWTFMIKWGITLSAASQRMMLKLCTVLMCLVTFLGLAAIWGTYWINLRQ